MKPETTLILCLLGLIIVFGGIRLFIRWSDCADENFERQDREDGKRW